METMPHQLTENFDGPLHVIQHSGICSTVPASSASMASVPSTQQDGPALLGFHHQAQRFTEYLRVITELISSVSLYRGHAPVLLITEGLKRLFDTLCLGFQLLIVGVRVHAQLTHPGEHA